MGNNIYKHIDYSDDKDDESLCNPEIARIVFYTLFPPQDRGQRMPQEIALAQFVETESELLTKFERHWLKENRKNGETHPLMLDYQSWVEQFEAFLEDNG